MFGIKSQKTVDDIFDKDKGLLSKVGGWVGNAQFTEEERAELNTKNVLAIHKFVADTLAENTDRSKSRREIANFFMKFYGLLVFMCAMTYPINPDWSNVWFSLASLPTVGGLVISISVFYFGSHSLSKYQDKKEASK